MCKYSIKALLGIITFSSFLALNTISPFAEYSHWQLADNGHDESVSKAINNRAEISDNAPGTDGEIFFYDSTNIIQLTDNNYVDRLPQINNHGALVWVENDGNDDEIFLYDGTGITQLTDNDYHDMGERINNNGEVVWYGRNSESVDTSAGSWSGGWGNIKPCFISTSAYGLRTSKDILTMALLFISLLIVFYSCRAKLKISRKERGISVHLAISSRNIQI